MHHERRPPDGVVVLLQRQVAKLASGGGAVTACVLSRRALPCVPAAMHEGHGRCACPAALRLHMMTSHNHKSDKYSQGRPNFCPHCICRLSSAMSRLQCVGQDPVSKQALSKQLLTRHKGLELKEECSGWSGAPSCSNMHRSGASRKLRRSKGRCGGCAQCRTRAQKGRHAHCAPLERRQVQWRQPSLCSPS